MNGEWVGLREALAFVEDRTEGNAEAQIIEKLRWGELRAQSERAQFGGKFASLRRSGQIDKSMLSPPVNTVDEAIPKAFFLPNPQIIWRENMVLYASPGYAESKSGFVFFGVHVRLSELEAIWGHADTRSEPDTPQLPVYSTGSPGHPTSRSLIEAEFRRRVETNEVASSMAAEGRHLSGWLSREHSAAPPATPKTIENNLRPVWRQLMARPPKR